MADQMDLVRRHYRAVNARDLDEVVAQYQRDSVTEAVFLHDPSAGTCRGQEENRARWAAMFAGWTGALDGGAFYQPRTIGGLETGWGWVHAEWVAGLAPRSGGKPRWFIGYSHFVLIDYLCRPVGGCLAHGSDVSAVTLADPHDLGRYELTPKAAGVIASARLLAARTAPPAAGVP